MEYDGRFGDKDPVHGAIWRELNDMIAMGWGSTDQCILIERPDDTYELRTIIPSDWRRTPGPDCESGRAPKVKMDETPEEVEERRKRRREVREARRSAFAEVLERRRAIVAARVMQGGDSEAVAHA